MRRNLVLEARSIGRDRTLAHNRTADDKRRTLLLGIGGREGFADLLYVMAVDGDDVPAPRLVFHRYVLGIHLIDLGRKLNVVRVVVHDQIVHPQVAGDAAHALRHLLLDTAVGDVGIGLVGLPLPETSREEPLGDRGAQRHGMPLAQRTRRILHTVQHVHFGMARRDAAPLPQVTQILHRIGSGQRESRVEHRRHVSRIEEETVPERIIHLIRIVAEEFGVKYCHEVRAAHCAAGMSRFGFLDHRCRQDTDVVCNAREFGFSNHKRLYAFIFFMYWPHSPGRHSAPIPDESAEYAQLGPLPAENIWKRRTKPKISFCSFGSNERDCTPVPRRSPAFGGTNLIQIRSIRPA